MDFTRVVNTYTKLSSRKMNSLRKECKYLLSEDKWSFYAYLLGKVMGDGHLAKTYSLQFVHKGHKDLEVLKHFISTLLDVPKGKMSITQRQARGTSYALRVNYALLGRILYCLGAPKGNKTKQGFLIPHWVRNSKEYSKKFLQALLEDELATIKIEKKNHSIKPKFKMAKDKRLVESLRLFLGQVKETIESFDVQCSAVSKEPKSRGDQLTKELYFDILRNKRNIIKFQEEIGFFLNREKTECLNHCCSILRATLRPEVDKKKILTLREQGLSIREIAKEVYHGKTTVHRIIKEARNL